MGSIASSFAPRVFRTHRRGIAAEPQIFVEGPIGREHRAARAAYLGHGTCAKSSRVPRRRRFPPSGLERHLAESAVSRGSIEGEIEAIARRCSRCRASDDDTARWRSPRHREAVKRVELLELAIAGTRPNRDQAEAYPRGGRIRRSRYIAPVIPAHAGKPPKKKEAHETPRFCRARRGRTLFPCRRSPRPPSSRWAELPY